MASRTSTPQSRSRSSSGSSSSSDTTMIDAPPQSPSRPVRLRNPSTSNPSASGPTTAPDPTFSLLLSLPRELRDRIYTFALTSPSPFWWPHVVTVKCEHQVSPNLLRASRQVYEEAVPIIYSGNKFIFTHPSDCNIFRVVAAPASQNITSVYFRIREKDLRLWTSYLGSKNQDRSLRADLPKLKSIWIFLRCGSMGTPAMLGQLGGAQALQGMPGGMGNLPAAIQMQVQAVQTALGHQVQQALQQQVQGSTQGAGNNAGNGAPQTPQAMGMDANGLGNGAGNQIPPPPPPPPGMPLVPHPQGGFTIVPPVQHGNHNLNLNPTLQHLAPHHANNNIPPPPPLHNHPLAPVQHLPNQGHQQHHHHQHTLYTTFLRFEREIGLESLCLSLQETLRERPIDSSVSSSAPPAASPTATATPSVRHVHAAPPEVKIVCIMRIPRHMVERFVRMHPGELSVDDKRDARTKFRKLHGVEVSLELSGYPNTHASGGGGMEEGGVAVGGEVQGP